MPEQIYIGNYSKGQITSRLPFVIDNDAFPMMYNFYSWRGRAKRKRGTIFLGQLELQEQIAAMPLPWQLASFNLVAGAGNLITQFTLGATASITPGSLSLIVATDQTYTDPLMDGTLNGSVSGLMAGTINYATGDFTTISGGNNAVTGGAAGAAAFSYFSGLPVMGLQDFSYISSPGLANVPTIYPFLLAFDTEKAYQINQSSSSVFFYDVSYYKYTNNPVIWSGNDYQLFWTTNYQSALWATNNKPGFSFKPLSNVMGVSITRVSATQVTITITGHQLIVNDVIWINEVTGTIATGSGATANQNINLQTGYVAAVVDANTITVNFDGTKGSTLANFQPGATGSGGIAQYLTSGVVTGQDGIRWYDGDPTNGTGLPTTTLVGWVNFAPPLTGAIVSIDDETAALYYLVGALAIVPFKDRLLFFSPWIQTSTGAAIQLVDTVIWSWNGTPYYSSATPVNETSAPNAYYVDQTGLGGWLSAGVAQPIKTVSNNEDVLIVGFAGRGRKTRFVYTSNDLQPFVFYNINSELPSDSTFSAVALDKGAIDIGVYGIAMTDQQSSQRIDLDIPDSVFQIQALNNGILRVNAIRDFQKEWIYFAYPLNSSAWRFPTQTFLFNYRDNTWAVQYENFTVHGTFRPQMKKSWLTTGFHSWNTWREAWNSGSSSPLYPNIVAGNPQGYVLIKGQGTGESISGTIQAITNNGGETQITSIDHCVQVGDYLFISGILGLLSSTITAITQASQAVISTVNTFIVGDLVTISGVVGMTQLNGNTYTIAAATGASITINVDSTNFTPYISGGTVTSAINGLIGAVRTVIDANNYVIDLPVPTFTTIYLGLGKFTRLSQPLLQTKQFNPYWDQGRQVRLSVQKYLMDFTANAQVTVNVYLSQNPDDVWNNVLNNPPPNGLVYSQLMYTCPESTNIGLTPANTNLQMPTASGQYQIWHRFNTSMIGDSVQIGITLNDAQMRNLTFATSEITLHGIHLTVDRSSHLA